ncbi:MAG: hypothetical protein NDJ92_16335, partial [Thermoanaerobaculia bacterium]|nr:hypothetical protein [Thermoanaerobaculia bacterium]
ATSARHCVFASIHVILRGVKLSSRECPWCRTRLAREVSDSCPTCGRALRDAEGNELREIDLVYDRVVAANEARFLRFLAVGTPIAALISLGGPLFHLGPAMLVALPLFSITHAIAFRLVLAGDARRLLGGRRRFFTRNISRWSFLLLTLVGYSFTAIPLAGALIGAATFAGVTWLAFRHLMWSLRRERDRAPLLLAERIALVVIAVAFVGIVAALLVFSLALGLGVKWLTQQLA